MSNDVVLNCPRFFDTLPSTYAVTYLLIDKINRHHYFDDVLINSEILSYSYAKNLNYNFDNELKSLLENSFITKLSNNYYLLKRESTNNLHIPFYNLPESDFNKILKTNKRNRNDLIVFYMKLLSTFDYNIEINGKKSIIGHMPYNYLGKCKSTVCDYMQTLQDLNLIYVIKRGINETNLYCRVCHKELLDQFYEGSGENNNSNFRRSVSARYNRYLANPGVYSHEEKIALYNDCLEYNKQMENMQKYQPGNDYVSKIKDISVFAVDETE